MAVFNLGATRDFKFQRDVDFDIDPTYFSEYSDNPSPINSVVESSYYGFESANPLDPYWGSAAGTFLGDNGGGIKLDLGTITTGGTASFSYYYAISERGQSAADLRAQVAALGGDYSVLNWDSASGANSALIGVNSVVTECVPEPASMAALGLGLAAIARRRRQSQ